MQTLKAEAKKLCAALKTIVLCLETFDQDDRQKYTRELAAVLRPQVLRFQAALDEKRSREEAKEVLDEIADLMYEINGAATKGEINFVSGKVLNTYWQLKTIFQESRFRDEHL